MHEDYDPKGQRALVTVPFEFAAVKIPVGKEVILTDFDGKAMGTGKVLAIRERKDQDRRYLIMLEVPFALRKDVAGFQIRTPDLGAQVDGALGEADPIVCRCERVRKSAIVREIRQGVRDINQLKALCRLSMGGCGGKTCTELVLRIFREEGVTTGEVTSGTIRPLIAEVPLEGFLAEKDKDDE